MNEKMNRIESLYNMLYKETDEIYGKLAHFFGMTSTAFWLLYFIREKNHCTQSEIASRLSIPKQTVNSSLKRLEKDGFIRLEADSDNHRNKLLSFTEKGEELAKSTIDRVFELEISAFSRFDDEEADMFWRLPESTLPCWPAKRKKFLKSALRNTGRKVYEAKNTA